MAEQLSLIEHDLDRRGSCFATIRLASESGTRRCQRRCDDDLAALAIKVADFSYAKGHDEKHGGIVAFVDENGEQPPGPEHIQFGERWDDKIWWVHGEAMYAMALAAVEGRAAAKATATTTSAPDRHFAAFEHLHQYTQEVFADPVLREWACYLQRDGSPHPQYPDKGTWIKCFFHVPRALMKLVLLFERESD